MARTVGGRVEITLSGRIYHPVAAVKVDESNIEPEVVDNQDGSIGRSVKSTHFSADITFRHMDGLDIQALIDSTFDFAMREIDTKQTVLLTDAFLTGKASRDTVTGEISGLTIVSDKYQRITAS